MWGLSKSWLSKSLEGAPPKLAYVGSLVSDFQPPDLWEIYVCCFCPPACGPLLWQRGIRHSQFHTSEQVGHNFDAKVFFLCEDINFIKLHFFRLWIRTLELNYPLCYLLAWTIIWALYIYFCVCKMVKIMRESPFRSYGKYFNNGL